VLLVAGLALTGCASGPTIVAPPAALLMNGVPPVPQDLAKRVGRYTEFRGVGLLDWRPDGGELLVTFLRGTRTQLHRAPAPGVPLVPVTAGAEPTRSGRYVPGNSKQLVIARDAGGNEVEQIFRLDLTTSVETLLTDTDRRHSAGPFTRAGTAIAATAVPLDRTAAGGTRSELTTELALIDIASGARRVVAELPGTGWFATDFSAGDRTLLVSLFRSAADSEVWRVDVTTGQRVRLLPCANERAASYTGALFAPDEKRLIVGTNRSGEFTQLFRVDTDACRFEPVTADIAWDVENLTIARNRSRLAFTTNEGGRGVARLIDANTLAPIALPPSTDSATRVALSPDGARLAVSYSGAATPSGVRVLDPARSVSTLWAAGDTAGIDTRAFSATQIIDWPSFDGRRISGLITRPPARFTGKRPVLIDVHGGPEVQARLNFNGRLNSLINELGVVLIEPNVRGSDGFGKTFLQLDDGRLREDAVKDLGALLDWIGRQNDLDASHVVVEGGSYGGYMALAAAVHYSDRLNGAISAVGISHFVSFLERTESYRRDLRRVEYGDERDPQMRAFLHDISPLTQAARIKTPLFLIHGRNDPRVPVQETLQIARAAAANGVPVWTLIADNEGHGFGKKENADYAFYARVMFLERYLLGDR